MKTSFQIKRNSFTLNILEILDSSCDNLKENMKFECAKAPQFFNNTPMLINLEHIENNIDISFVFNLKDILKIYNILPIGYHCTKKSLATVIRNNKLPIFKKETHHLKNNNFIQNNVRTLCNEVIHTKVRSGQQIIARNGDLIILSSVSAGAEVLAYGNIHIYGTLSGRALAGFQGNTNANIFCHKLKTDLVSIAGQYKMFEKEISPSSFFQNGYHIYLKNGKISLKGL